MSFKLNPDWIRSNITVSSQIKQLALDKEQKRLYVVFHNGSVYSYENVSYNEYVDFVKAPSIGKHFHSVIKPNKTSTKQSNGTKEL